MKTSAVAPLAWAPVNDLLASFMESLQSAQDQTSAYAVDGTRSGSQTASALLPNFTA